MSRKEKIIYTPLPKRQRPDVWLPTGHVVNTAFHMLREMTFSGQKAVEEKLSEDERIRMFFRHVFDQENQRFALAAIQLYPTFGLSGEEMIQLQGGDMATLRIMVLDFIAIFQLIDDCSIELRSKHKEEQEKIYKRLNEKTADMIAALPNYTDINTGLSLKNLVEEMLGLKKKNTARKPFGTAFTFISSLAKHGS